mgnify:CR=1 FL=1
MVLRGWRWGWRECRFRRKWGKRIGRLEMEFGIICLLAVGDFIIGEEGGYYSW